MQLYVDIKILRELVNAIAGKNTEAIVDILKDKKNVNEFKIAEKLGLTINQARNILYKLYDEGIVSFIRKKDKQKGWYIYYWTLSTAKALKWFVATKRREIENQKHQLASRETKRFFSCPTCHIELNEETALHYDFICQECGQVLSLTLKEEKVEEAKKALEEAKKQLALAEGELAKIAEKEVRKAAREEAKKAKPKKKLTRKAKKAKIKPKKAKIKPKRVKAKPKAKQKKARAKKKAKAKKAKIKKK